MSQKLQTVPNYSFTRINILIRTQQGGEYRRGQGGHVAPFITGPPNNNKIKKICLKHTLRFLIVHTLLLMVCNTAHITQNTIETT